MLKQFKKCKKKYKYNCYYEIAIDASGNVASLNGLHLTFKKELHPYHLQYYNPEGHKLSSEARGASVPKLLLFPRHYILRVRDSENEGAAPECMLFSRPLLPGEVFDKKELNLKRIESIFKYGFKVSGAQMSLGSSTHRQLVRECFVDEYFSQYKTLAEQNTNYQEGDLIVLHLHCEPKDLKPMISSVIEKHPQKVLVSVPKEYLPKPKKPVDKKSECLSVCLKAGVTVASIVSSTAVGYDWLSQQDVETYGRAYIDSWNQMPAGFTNSTPMNATWRTNFSALKSGINAPQNMYPYIDSLMVINDPIDQWWSVDIQIESEVVSHISNMRTNVTSRLAGQIVCDPIREHGASGAQVIATSVNDGEQIYSSWHTCPSQIFTKQEMWQYKNGVTTWKSNTSDFFYPGFYVEAGAIQLGNQWATIYQSYAQVAYQGSLYQYPELQFCISGICYPVSADHNDIDFSVTNNELVKWAIGHTDLSLGLMIGGSFVVIAVEQGLSILGFPNWFQTPIYRAPKYWVIHTALEAFIHGASLGAIFKLGPGLFPDMPKQSADDSSENHQAAALDDVPTLNNYKSDFSGLLQSPMMQFLFVASASGVALSVVYLLPWLKSCNGKCLQAAQMLGDTLADVPTVFYFMALKASVCDIDASVFSPILATCFVVSALNAGARRAAISVMDKSFFEPKRPITRWRLNNTPATAEDEGNDEDPKLPDGYFVEATV